jgi:hypothetical protein
VTHGFLDYPASQGSSHIRRSSISRSRYRRGDRRCRLHAEGNGDLDEYPDGRLPQRSLDETRIRAIDGVATDGADNLNYVK